MFKDNRSAFRIAEPLVTFYHAVMRPIWSDLEHTRDASRLWALSQRRFSATYSGRTSSTSAGIGPRHMRHRRSSATTRTVSEPEQSMTRSHKTSHEVNVVVFGLDDDNRSPLLAIGEAKWKRGHGGRGTSTELRRIRTLLS